MNEKDEQRQEIEQISIKDIDLSRMTKTVISHEDIEQRDKKE